MLSELTELLLIVNPCSGTLRGKDAFFDIVNTFSSANLRVTVRMTQHRGHAHSIAREEGPLFPAIVCCGGDGTLHEVVCGIMELPYEKRPFLGYIPTGTTNDFASSLGLPADPLKGAERLLHAEPELLDVGYFGMDAEGKSGTNFVYTASIGAFTESSYRTPQRYKNAIGYMAYFLDGLAHLDSIRPVSMRIQAGEQIFEDEYIFASVSNTTSVGKMIKLKNVSVNFQDGLFELILIKNPKSLKDAEAIARSLLPRTHSEPSTGLVRAQISSVTIQTENKMAWTLDGEYVRAPSTFTACNLKKQLAFLL